MVDRTIKTLQSLNANGGTNLYDGLSLAVDDIDDDRATSVVWVTDAVTNTGVVSPSRFHKLMKGYDIRVFGFLMGNGANWPLMRTICDVSGGFSASVSNSDDIIGQILLAKSKVTHECLHDAKLTIRGVKAYDISNEFMGKVYRGQQLVFLGRYEGAGTATVSLQAKLTGEDKTYSTTFDFPEIGTSYPEIERLWALNQIEMIQGIENAGLMPEEESEAAIRDLGVSYQLVTDYTSMIVLSDEIF